MDCVKCHAELPPGALYCPSCGKKQSAVASYTRRRGNGQGTAYKRGKYWTASTVIGWKWDQTSKRVPVRRYKGGFATKGDALAYLPTLRGKQAKKEVTLESLYEIWSNNSLPKLSKSKQTAYKIAHNKITAILYCELSSITIGQLQELVNEKAPTFYPAKDIKTLLSHLYTMAVAQQDVVTNLADYIELPTLDEAEQIPFSIEEQNALWADYSSGNIFTGYILLMIYTGMMPGELFDARKDMVDFTSHTITGCGKKTKKRKATPMVVSDLVEPVLQNLCDSTPGDKLLRMNRDNFYITYKETLARCGCRPLPPYSCRHTTATALALQDIPLSVVKEVMRHTKITTTQRYVHVGVAPMLEAVNKTQKETITVGDAPANDVKSHSKW